MLLHDLLAGVKAPTAAIRVSGAKPTSAAPPHSVIVHVIPTESAIHATPVHVRPAPGVSQITSSITHNIWTIWQLCASFGGTDSCRSGQRYSSAISFLLSPKRVSDAISFLLSPKRVSDATWSPCAFLDRLIATICRFPGCHVI
jgi:hypothetical protein